MRVAMAPTTPEAKILVRYMGNGDRRAFSRLVRRALRGWDARRSFEGQLREKRFLPLKLGGNHLAVPRKNRPGRKPEHTAALIEYSHLNAITRAYKHVKANVLNEVRG